MGVLFNLYTTPDFVLPGQAMTPGKHTLIFDLASNTHLDFANTVQEIKITSRRQRSLPAPAAADNASVAIVAPADGATVGAQFELAVAPGQPPALRGP